MATTMTDPIVEAINIGLRPARSKTVKAYRNLNGQRDTLRPGRAKVYDAAEKAVAAAVEALDHLAATFEPADEGDEG